MEVSIFSGFLTCVLCSRMHQSLEDLLFLLLIIWGNSLMCMTTNCIYILNLCGHLFVLGEVQVICSHVAVKRSSGFNVKIVVSGARYLLMLFFNQNGHVLGICGTLKGKSDIKSYNWIILFVG